MRHVAAIAIFTIGSIFSMPSIADSEFCKKTSKMEIENLFHRWNRSLQTEDPKKVVANYGKQSVLLPTLSNRPRIEDEEKIDYFQHFLAKKPTGQIDSSKIEIGCNIAIDTGLYTFTLGDGNQIRARYTYIYKFNGKEWLIASHHSSIMPEKH